MIEKLKALEAAATPAPWVREESHGVHLLLDAENPIEIADFGDVGDPQHEPQTLADMAFVAAFRELATDLIALWEAVDAWSRPRPIGDMGLAQVNALLNAMANLEARAAEVLE